MVYHYSSYLYAIPHNFLFDLVPPRIMWLTRLQAVSWSFTGLAVLLTICRLWIRCTIIKGLFWDDAAHMLALACLLIQISLVTAATTMAYHVVSQNSTEEAAATQVHLLRINYAAIVIVWTCLYAVKLAFLLLYRRIFQVSQNFMKAWWTVLAMVVAMYSATIVGAITQCGNPSHLGSMGNADLFHK